jgi:hypothetical protein
LRGFPFVKALTPMRLRIIHMLNSNNRHRPRQICISILLRPATITIDHRLSQIEGFMTS